MSTLEPGVTGKRPHRRGRPARVMKTHKARAPPGSPLTLSGPEAGRKYYGPSRNGSYAAADRGDIPTVRVGKLRRVPVRAMERKLDEAGREETSEV
jgi:hypothetical protein